MKKDLRKLLPDGKTVILAFDHGFEHGPVPYTGVDMSPARVLKLAQEGKADALLVHRGFVSACGRWPKDLGLIVKLTARTSLLPKDDEVQALVCTVEDALAVGADAVGITVYLGAAREKEMLEQYGWLASACRRHNLPIVGFMYPRVPHQNVKFTTEQVRYAARVGSELDCDIIKTYYTGSKETFAQVVKDAYKPVVAAGGHFEQNELGVLRNVEDVMAAKAAGMAIGRNAWGRAHGEKFLRAVGSIVHQGLSSHEAAKKYL